MRRQDALDHEELERALGAALLREEDLGHPARAEALEDLELGELRGERFGHAGANHKDNSSGRLGAALARTPAAQSGPDEEGSREGRR